MGSSQSPWCLMGHSEIPNHRFSLCMTWTRDDTKDVLKKVLGTIIAMALISFVSVLADVDVVLLFAVLAMCVIALLIFLATRKHSPSGNLSRIDAEPSESSIAKKDESNSKTDEGPNLLSPEPDYSVQNTKMKARQPVAPALVMDISQARREKIKRKQTGNVSEAEKTPHHSDVDELVSLFDGLVEVEKQESLHFLLDKGDVVKGTLRETDGQSFDLYIMDERNYAKFSASRDEKSSREFLDESSYFVRWIVPESGEWYFVLDLYGKQYSREIEIVLRRSRSQS